MRYILEALQYWKTINIYVTVRQIQFCWLHCFWHFCPVYLVLTGQLSCNEWSLDGWRFGFFVIRPSWTSFSILWRASVAQSINKVLEHLFLSIVKVSSETETTLYWAVLFKSSLDLGLVAEEAAGLRCPGERLAIINWIGRDIDVPGKDELKYIFSSKLSCFHFL